MLKEKLYAAHQALKELYECSDKEQVKNLTYYAMRDIEMLCRQFGIATPENV